jgi:hypothetical protein
LWDEIAVEKFSDKVTVFLELSRVRLLEGDKLVKKVVIDLTSLCA